ncbi:MAG: ATP-binding protein [Poseidonibacter sp.]|uniref:ATP-binding protein n=1 Tax=Poseidonibacter sp. TaxID=2321188 RepID=UPI00359DF5EC
MHRLLKRQLNKFLKKSNDFETLDPELKSLLNAVSQVYNDFDEQRKINEHIITVNSEELENTNNQLKKIIEERSELLKNKTNENKDIINLLHQYKDAIDKSLIVSRTDKNGIITYVNDKFCQISGYSKEELIGSSHNIVKNPANSDSLFKNIWDTITNKEIWHGTFSNLSKDGKVYYVTSTIVPLTDADGNIIEYMGLRDEVTKRVVYEKNMKNQTQRLNTIFNSQENITIIIKPKFGITAVNQKFFETFGYKNLEDFKNSMECVCDLFNERDTLKSSDGTDFKWYERFLVKNSNTNKVTRTNEHGIEQIFQVTCKEIELNESQHFLVTFVDITELENARKKAEIAKQTKSNFLANMSHEIRTPLNAIIGFSDILLKANLEQEPKEYSRIISKSAESLLDIIDDVLDISKIESGKIDIENEAFPISIFIENIIELFSIKAQEKNIRFIYDSDPTIPYSIVSDSTRLRQVLSNLLSNAIKFTQENGQVLFIMKAIEQTPTDVKIKFIIEDSGIGISKSQQEIIFEPFSQADSGISRKFGGTGLGLAICKDIINLLKSDIIVESEENTGSKFSFILDFKIDKKDDQRTHHFSHLKFAVSDIENDSEHLKISINNYLNKVGEVYKFDKNSVINNIDFLFCFDSKNLLETLTQFKLLNKSSRIVYVGDKNSIKSNEIGSLIHHFIDLPIYGSKIFNIISDNTVIEQSDIKFEVLDKEKNSKKHILVAEDNPNNQKLIEVLINHLNIKCTIAENGQEAVDLYKENFYDLIFMDINMPVLDGVNATKKILKLQKEENTYQVPIIALTANSIEGDKERYLYAGMNDYMAKPIKVDELNTMIQKYTNLAPKHTIKEEVITIEKFEKNNLIESLGLSENIIDMLLNKFFTNIDNDLKKLQDFMEDENYEEIHNQAHFIKGSCLNLAMNTAASILKDIEKKSKNNYHNLGDIDKLKQVFLEIKKTI